MLTLLPAQFVCVAYLLSPAAFQACDSASDVWLQLLEHCASIFRRQPAMVRDLGLRLVEQQLLHQVRTQQHTITQLQRQVSAHEDINQQLQQQTSQLQQQAAEAVELRGQVSELRGQVAQLMQALQHRG